MSQNQPKTTEMTGGEAAVRVLLNYGVDCMFGMGGFQLLPLYEAARQLGLKHHLINDERSGIFAADAYARVSGKVGVCDATLGPGATNLVTGLVESWQAGIGLVVITGNSHRDHSGKNMTQEGNQNAILRNACKELLQVESTERVPEILRRAFAVATSGRPGPVVVDISEDVSHGVASFSEADLAARPRYLGFPAVRCRPDSTSVAEAVALLRSATRPMILAGGGVHISGAQEALTRFAQTHRIAVAHTLSGKGSIPCTHPYSAGIFGRYSRIANDMMAEADLLISVGCKFGEIATRRYELPGEGKKIIHIDSLPEEFERTTQVTLPLWGDARETLLELDAALADNGGPACDGAFAETVAGKMDAWRDSVSARLSSDETPVNMARLMTELNGALPEGGLLVADGGFAAHWSGLLFDTTQAGRYFLANRGLCSIGYGVPGAIGAQIAAGPRPVFALTGDGGFNMSIGELETALRLKLGFTMIIVNNAASGYVKALQHLMYGQGAYQSSDLFEIDYAKVAEAMGCHAERVTTPDQLAGAFGRAAAETARPSVIDVVVTRDASKMLPGVDNRTVKHRKGDRVA